jgi:UTP:GlnB (protein PII) uridylyltransferase
MKHDTDFTAFAAIEPRILLRRPQSGILDSGNTFVEDFLASMPERYRQDFGKVSARQHARIAIARGRHPIYADFFLGSSATGPGICVVATDAPGLLAVISTSLMLEGFDITRADAYTRRAPSGEYEAVDLFWVRRISTENSAGLGEQELSALRSTLRELLSCGDVRKRLRAAPPGTSPGASETRVEFRSTRGTPWLTLELESNDRPGLLAVVTAALAAEGVRIVDSRIRTHGLRVHDYFDILESDGTRPRGVRLQRIQLAVLTAIDGPRRGA